MLRSSSGGLSAGFLRRRIFDITSGTGPSDAGCAKVSSRERGERDGFRLWGGNDGRNTLTLTLSHRGRGDRTTPPPPGIRVMQGSHQGRGEGMDSRLGGRNDGSPLPSGEGEGQDHPSAAWNKGYAKVASRERGRDGFRLGGRNDGRRARG